MKNPCEGPEEEEIKKETNKVKIYHDNRKKNLEKISQWNQI